MEVLRKAGLAMIQKSGSSLLDCHNVDSKEKIQQVCDWFGNIWHKAV